MKKYFKIIMNMHPNMHPIIYKNTNSAYHYPKTQLSPTRYDDKYTEVRFYADFGDGWFCRYDKGNKQFLKILNIDSDKAIEIYKDKKYIIKCIEIETQEEFEEEMFLEFL